MWKEVWARIARKDNVLAFGAELSSCRYRLMLARYVGLADVIRHETRPGRVLRVLDVGCGQGRLILYGPFAGAEFIGMDISRSSLDTALDRGYSKAVEGSVSGKLPFVDESFDVVVCSHILEHLPEPEELVSEAWRLLRPEGVLIVGVPICVWWTRLLRIYLLPLIDRTKRPELLAARHGHIQFFTIPRLKALLVPFRIEDIRGFRFFSAGRYLPLEDWLWFYRLNIAWGKICPRLTSEVNVIARKTRSDPCASAIKEVDNGISPMRRW